VSVLVGKERAERFATLLLRALPHAESVEEAVAAVDIALAIPGEWQQHTTQTGKRGWINNRTGEFREQEARPGSRQHVREGVTTGVATPVQAPKPQPRPAPKPSPTPAPAARQPSPQETGYDPETGQILDAKKYAAHQQAQRQQQQAQTQQRQPEDINAVFKTAQGRLSAWMDLPKNQGRTGEQLLQDPDYVRFTQQFTSNLTGALGKWIQSAAQNRAAYRQPTRKPPGSSVRDEPPDWNNVTELLHTTSYDLPEGIPTKPDMSGLVWFFADPEKRGTYGSYGDKQYRMQIPRNKVLDLNDADNLQAYLASPFGGSRSKGREHKYAESLGYWAILRGDEIAMTPRVARAVKNRQPAGAAGKQFGLDADFSLDIFNRRAQGVLNKALAAAKGLTAAAKKELAALLKNPDQTALGNAILSFIAKYRQKLAEVISSTQMASLLSGAQEVAQHLPEGLPLSSALPPTLSPKKAAALLERLDKLPELEKIVEIQKLPPAEQSWARLTASAPARSGAFPEAPSFRPAATNYEEGMFPVIDEGVRLLQEKQIVTKEVFDRLDDATRQKAFTVAGVEAHETLERIRDAIAENLQEGVDLETFQEKILDSVGHGTFLSEAHLETVFRTNVQSAFSDGQLGVLQLPLVKGGFPYATYEPIEDDRVRDEHLALHRHGIGGSNVFRTDDPVFQTFRPPWDYNCRCSWIPVTVESAAEMGVEEAKRWLETGEEPSPPAFVPWPPFRPPAGFQRPVEAVFSVSETSLSEFAVSLGMVGDEWHGPEPPGPGWVEVGRGERGGKIWKQSAGAAGVTPTAKPTAQDSQKALLTYLSQSGAQSINQLARAFKARPEQISALIAPLVQGGFLESKVVRGSVVYGERKKAEDLPRQGSLAEAARSLAYKYGRDRRGELPEIPIAELRPLIRMPPEQFNEAVLQMWRDGFIRLEKFTDFGSLTDEQKAASLPGGYGYFYPLEKLVGASFSVSDEETNPKLAGRSLFEPTRTDIATIDEGVAAATDVTPAQGQGVSGEVAESRARPRSRKYKVKRRSATRRKKKKASLSLEEHFGSEPLGPGWTHVEEFKWTRPRA
jgi:SPP1 gp7 family putative phage head morphogenesis protein